MGRNLWDSLGQGVRNKNMALFVYGAGWVALVCGFVLSLEDWRTSYFGFRMVEQHFGIAVTTMPWVLIVMAFTPWVGQIIFFTIWTLDTDKKKYLVAAAVMFLIDLVSDVQFHSQNNLLPLPGVASTLPAGVNRWVNVAVAFGFTTVFFTVGAELFIVSAVAIVSTLYIPAAEQYADIQVARLKARKRKDEIMRGIEGRANDGGGGQQQQPKQDNQQKNRQNGGNQARPRERDGRQQQPPPPNPFILPGVPTAITDPAELEELLGRSPRRQ